MLLRSRETSVVVAKALDGEAAGGGGNRRGSVMAPKDLPDEAVIKRAPMVRRRLHLDNQQDLQDWLAKCNLKTALKSRFLEPLNKGMIKASKQHGPVLDHVEKDLYHAYPELRIHIGGQRFSETVETRYADHTAVRVSRASIQNPAA